MISQVGLKNVTISAKVIRANGTVEDLGVVCTIKPDSKMKKLFKKLGGKVNG